MLQRKRPSDEIPTSSMADVAFLLVVYFMLTLTLSAQKGLDFSIPEDEEARVIEPVESVLVEILPSGALEVDRRPLALADLLGYLAPKLERNPEKPIILRPHPEAPYGAMLEVYDVLRQGRDELGLADDIQVALPTEREIAGWI